MKSRLLLTLALAAALVPFGASAHKAWLLPSQTVIAGENPWITVDAAVSNDLFHFNHVPLPLERLAITAPDGKAAPSANGLFESAPTPLRLAFPRYRVFLYNATPRTSEVVVYAYLRGS